MAITQRIISEIYDNEDDKVLKRIIIKEKVVVDPKKIDDVAYNQAEQISILQDVQDEYLSRMASMMGEASCSKCGGTTARTGQVSSDFHSIYTDHKVKLSRRKCKVCGLEHNKTIHSLFGSNMHPDLVKRQAEVGSETSYMKAQIELEKESGKCRSINNRYTIKKTVDRVGEVLDILHKQEINSQNITAAKHLIVQTDGGFVKDKNPKMRSFEVLISKVYNIEEHDVGYIDKNGIRRSGNINNKIYAASALKDRNLSIKKMTMTAALRQGMTSFTKVTAISDGAKNCWDVLKSLKEHCKD